MANIIKTATAVAACLIACAAQAQDTPFDLGAQRAESHDVNPVPGAKIDHQGIIINPTPQAITLDKNKALDISAGIRIEDSGLDFADDITFIATNPRGTRTVITCGGKEAEEKGVKNVPGAYVLQIDADGITITGHDEAGAFYGIQTLRQIIESPAAADGKLPHAYVNDYPDLPFRGVVEGFYGIPWTLQARLSLIDFYGRHKMNTYIYGPKDDPYHSSPHWRMPYPAEQEQGIKQLIDACKRNRVNFVWAVHPGQDIKWNEEDYANLVAKFNMMYELGTRAFAIFFDDISGPGTDPEKQAELVNKLNDDFVKAKGDVQPLIVCPTDYSKLWADPTEQGALAIYGRTLHPSANVFWTGDVVCSDLTDETLRWVNERIKRPAYYWWNYPVTDYAKHIVMQGPAYGLSSAVSANDVSGFVSNPMEHAEASKLALYGVADYAWNTAAYNPIDNWERGLAELAGPAAAAYRTFAIHSCDTETGYRRDESWETQTFTLATYDEETANRLHAEFTNIEAVPQQFAANCTNKQLAEELKPWLDEFGKLGTRGRKAVELIKAYKQGLPAAQLWEEYLKNTMTPAQRAAYVAHKSGTMKLQPFYENAMDDVASALLEKITGHKPVARRGIGTFPTATTTQAKHMFDGDTTTYYTSAKAQRPGDWIGVDLGKITEITEIRILQGRNSSDDVDYFDNAALECSADGEQWTTLIGGMKKQYDIHWQGAPVNARYVRLLRLDSGRTNHAAVRSFDVNPPSAEKLPFAIECDDANEAALMFDERLDTTCEIDGEVAIALPDGIKTCTILFADSNGTTATVKQLAADGTLLAETRHDHPFAQVEITKGAEKIVLQADKAEVAEIMTL